MLMVEYDKKLRCIWKTVCELIPRITYNAIYTYVYALHLICLTEAALLEIAVLNLNLLSF